MFSQEDVNVAIKESTFLQKYFQYNLATEVELVSDSILDLQCTLIYRV